jgi:hypothetical protein
VDLSSHHSKLQYGKNRKPGNAASWMSTRIMHSVSLRSQSERLDPSGHKPAGRLKASLMSVRIRVVRALGQAMIPFLAGTNPAVMSSFEHSTHYGHYLFQERHIHDRQKNILLYRGVHAHNWSIGILSVHSDTHAGNPIPARH